MRFLASRSVVILGVTSVVSLVLGACSAIIDPDETLLGGGPVGGDGGGGTMDGGSRRDGGPGPVDGGPGVDSGPRPDDGGGVDSGPPPCAFDARCESDVLVECVGGVEMRTPCTLGCAETTTAHCGEMIPSNVDASLWDPSAEDVIVEADTRFDTTTCAAMRGASEVVSQADGSEVCVLHAAAFRVAERGALYVGGTRPLVVMATGEVLIDGLIDVSGRGVEAGPGGGRGGSGTSDAADWGGGGPHGGGYGAHEGGFDDGGGGGGSFCGGGGDGGQGGGAAGGFGGTPETAAYELEPLLGGSGGGRGRGAITSIMVNAGLGGGGGGALQISSPTRIRVNGRILAGGGGGGAGQTAGGTGSNWGSGGGGGSGGAILLEAPTVQFDAAAELNAAGGGGGGSASTMGSGDNGQDGRDAGNARAHGGADRGGSYGARGGDGDAPNDLGALNGEDNTGTSANGGGGGGGAGCILVRAAVASATGAPERHPDVAHGYRELAIHVR